MKALSILLGFLGAILIANIILLDILFLKSNTKTSGVIDESIPTVDTRISSKTPSSETSCSPSCVALINEATSSLKLSTASPVLVEQSPSSDTGASVKEYYISLGSGSNSTSDWTDVGGVQAYVDTLNYSKIRQAFFEVTIHIPNGNQKVYARLYNATDKHPVWFSEVSLEGSQPTLLISDQITLDAGNKLYQVQMKTQLKDKANLLQARVRILTY